MPETTICFDTSTIDLRVEMRGVLAELRTSPFVNSVRRADVPPEQGRQSWVIDHDGLYEYGGTAESRALATRLRRLEVLPRAEDDYLARQTWDRTYGTPERPEPRFQQDLVRRALESQASRSALAQSMIAPLRQRLDYSAIGRRTFLVEQLPQGALPTYEALTDLIAPPPPPPGPEARINNVLRADRVRIPEFEMASSPTIRLDDIRQRRFNLIERQPPAPPPPWVGVGVYIRNKKDAEDLWVITGIDQYNATIERWRGVYRTATVAFSSLTDRYEPCLAPASPPTRFERDLEV